MKLAVVVQRYGTQINGGAELHARYIVELLAKQHQVEVLTTCARDYVTWKAEYAEGTETLRGVPVRRFAVSRERDPDDFGRRSTHVFEHTHSLADELAWLESEGPTCPALIDHLRAHDAEYDYIFFFSYRYYHAYQGARAVPSKAILVPTAERDSTIGLSMFGPIFRGVRAVMYNSHEERAMIQAATGNTQVPGVVVGVGSDVPRQPVAARFRRKYRISDPFIIYVGRIDENKGCRELFSFFTSYQPRLGQRLKLVLIGDSILPIPDHPNVHHLGFVSDQDKFDAMAAADALIMPSYYESLSMVALEAWALGRPVLANGRCDVLRGQCIRSRAGLYYETFEEFAETLFTLTTNRTLAEALGENGRQYFDQHYAWPVIERKYGDMLQRLAQEDAAGRAAAPIEALPGWLMRRRKVLPPGIEVLKKLPHGPAIGGDQRDDPFDGTPAPVTAASSSASHAAAVASWRPSASSSSSSSASSSAASSASSGAASSSSSDAGESEPASTSSDASTVSRASDAGRRQGPRHERSGRRGSSSGQSRSGQARSGQAPSGQGQSGQPRTRNGEGGGRPDGRRDRRDPGAGGQGQPRDASRQSGQPAKPASGSGPGSGSGSSSGSGSQGGAGGGEREGDRAAGPRPPRRDGAGSRGRRSGDRRSGPRGGS